MDLPAIKTLCAICEHQEGVKACSRWGSDSWSHPRQENALGSTAMDICSGLAVAHSLLQGQGPFPAGPRILLWTGNEPSAVLGFIFNLFPRSDGEIRKAEGENCCGLSSATGRIWNKTLPCFWGKIKVVWKPEKMSLSFQYWLVFIEHTHFC